MFGASVHVVMQSDISAVPEHFLVHSVICALYWKVCHSGEVMHLLKNAHSRPDDNSCLIYYLRILCESCCIKFGVLGTVMYWCWAVMVIKFSEILSGWQLHQQVQVQQFFGEWLYLIIRLLMWFHTQFMHRAYRVFFNPLYQLSGKKILIVSMWLIFTKKSYVHWCTII
jgi:hypothetical protein